ncbi:MAG TPA: ankyrin repeat domain-containing protein [Thermoanaerobaculia bacterium]|nr:ankyrin repeat domain-containing protein [Thermoanaerobaculia bacterium]
MRATRRGLCGWFLALSAVAMAPTPGVAAPTPTPVADAARDGDRETVRELLSRGEDPNAAHGDGLSPLHWAAVGGDRELAEMLLHAGARLTAKTRNGAFTPLLLAARAGNAAVVELLLEAGADPDQAADTGATALMLAAASGDAAAVTALLDAGSKPNLVEGVFGQSALVFAASANRAETIAALIAGGADPSLASTVTDAEQIEARNREAVIQRRALIQAQARIAKEAEERAAEAAAEKAASEAGHDDAERAGEDEGELPDETRPPPAVAAPEMLSPQEPIDPELGGNPPRAAGVPERSDPKPRREVGTADGPRRAGRARQESADAIDPELGGSPPSAAAMVAKQEEEEAEEEAEEAEQATKDGAVKVEREAGSRDRDEERKGPRPATMGQLVGRQGGLTPLLHAARGGHVEATKALLAGGADVDQPSAGDHTSPLLMATLNGRFDLAMLLLAQGADPTLASDAGVTPLYAAINVQWAPHAFYPQPSPAQETTTHLELMQALLAAGADPNARLDKKVWYTGYNFDQSGADETGATAFWRAAQSSDVAAMRLLVDAGADPTIASKVVPERRLPNGRNADADLDPPGEDAPPELGSPAISPLQVASGAGWVGNYHRNAPGGMLPAVRYLVEELGADVRAADYRGYTPLHNAAARGDVEMILYLVFHGADVTAVARSGETVADMANGPVQRIQPFPEALALLEAMGSKNNHNCVSC